MGIKLVNALRIACLWAISLASAKIHRPRQSFLAAEDSGRQSNDASVHDSTTSSWEQRRILQRLGGDKQKFRKGCSDKKLVPPMDCSSMSMPTGTSKPGRPKPSRKKSRPSIAPSSSILRPESDFPTIATSIPSSTAVPTYLGSGVQGTPTVTPTSTISDTPTVTCSSISRQEAIMRQLSMYTDESLLVDPATSQGYSYEWILNVDGMQLDPCVDMTVTQRYALVVLYVSTNGNTTWINATGWLSNTNECTWYGIVCGEQLEVEIINLDANGVSGSIPEEIRILTSMSTLSLFQNHLAGTIPQTLPELLNLQVFDVELNNLIGPAFLSWPNEPQLESYRISWNLLSGSIPMNVLQQLPNLRELWASSNFIEGSIPVSIGTLTKLESMYLSDNMLVGSIPSEIGNLSLSRMQLHRNLLIGLLPETLWRNTNMVEMRLDANAFLGTLSTGLGNMTGLTDLRIGQNEFMGTFPTEIQRLSNLVILSVNTTKLTGPLADVFATFQALQYVDLSNSSLTGTIPASFFEAPSLQILYLDDNDLTGTIPFNYGNASLLRDLYLQGNALVGTVPSIRPGQLESLTEFRIERNNITGSIPASICALRGRDTETDLYSLTVDCSVQCDCCTRCFSV